MKKLFSQLYQLSFVVRDIDDAVARFEALGIGPFKPVKGMTPVDRTLNGKVDPNIKNETRLAYLGDIEMELIEPISGGSPHMEFLKSKGEGLHHIAFLVDDLGKEVAEIEKKGFNVFYHLNFAEGTGGCAYFKTDLPGGIPVELFQPPDGWHKNKPRKREK